MPIKVEDYYAPATFQKMKAFADQHETPFVVIDTATISKAYDDLRAGFEFAKVYYAVKANPAVEIIELLKEKGSNFDIASIYELDRVLGCGVGPERISYGNTIKKAKDIRYFYEKGVRMYATDSEADLRNIAKVKVIFERLKEEDGIVLQMINMGGGFPANYITRTNSLETYAEEIIRFLKDDLCDDLPEIILEPGRSLISNAGILVSEVVLVARKSRTAVERWVYVDVGK